MYICAKIHAFVYAHKCIYNVHLYVYVCPVRLIGIYTYGTYTYGYVEMYIATRNTYIYKTRITDFSCLRAYLDFH